MHAILAFAYFLCSSDPVAVVPPGLTMRFLIVVDFVVTEQINFLCLVY